MLLEIMAGGRGQSQWLGGVKVRPAFGPGKPPIYIDDMTVMGQRKAMGIALQPSLFEFVVLAYYYVMLLCVYFGMLSLFEQ